MNRVTDMATNQQQQIKVYMGSVQFQSVRSSFGEVSAHVPFFMFHQSSNDNDSSNSNEHEIQPVVAPKPPRMIRYESTYCTYCSVFPMSAYGTHSKHPSRFGFYAQRAILRNRFNLIRLTSVDNEAGKDQPLLVW